jgi:spore coat protein U-like protein
LLVKSVVPAVVLGLLTLGLTSTSASAATQTATILVTANVVDSCTISASALSFGAYSGTALPAQATLTVTCTDLGTYTVGLNGGTTTGGTDQARKLAGPGGNTLNYNLYTTSALTTIWGNTSANHWQSGTGTGSAQTLTVYGNITAGQTLHVGSYTDSVTATITY